MDLTEKFHGIRNLIVHADGSITRPAIPTVPANPEFVGGVASKDVILDEELGIWVRIFVPETAVQSGKKIPVVLYFHGGGFIVLSPASNFVHKYSEKFARSAEVVLVSVKYRLAPEHRLPAAYEDGFTALKWLQAQARAVNRSSFEAAEVHDGTAMDPWIAAYCNFDHCLLMGDSAGGNLVHHLSLRALHTNLSPLRIIGQILVQPFFSAGRTPTLSETESYKDTKFGLEARDVLAKLALPVTADLSHPFTNVYPEVQRQKGNLCLPRTLVVVGGRDALKDSNVQYCNLLKETKTDCRLLFFEDGIHGFFIHEHKDASSCLAELGNFIATVQNPEIRVR